MILTADEVVVVERLRKENPVIEKLWTELQKYDGNEALKVFASICEKVKNYDENAKTLDAREFKRYMLFITNSKKIQEGIQFGQNIKDKLNGGVEEKVKVKLKQEESMSLSDLMAEKSSKSK
jgi:hypothetical protein